MLYNFEQFLQSVNVNHPDLKSNSFSSLKCPDCGSNSITICFCGKGDKKCQNCGLQFMLCKFCKTLTKSRYDDGKHFSCLNCKR